MAYSKLEIFKLSLVEIASFHEIFDTIYDLQYRLNIDDKYLLSTIKNPDLDKKHEMNLTKLRDASLSARNRIITWNLRHTSTELSATISLLTAKIKFIEYKLDKSDGLDLHQACSLALVNFCNILADKADVFKTEPAERETMHKVSQRIGIPVWLSHYRNQICHMPSESPCIAILVPLVVKSLTHLRDSFWIKLIKSDQLDAAKFKNVINYVIVHSQDNLQSPTKAERECQRRKVMERVLAQQERIDKFKRATTYLRKCLRLHPADATSLIAEHLSKRVALKDRKKCGELFKLTLDMGCFERLIYCLIRLVEEKSTPCAKGWLHVAFILISNSDKTKISHAMTRCSIRYSLKTQGALNLAPMKICQIAYRLTELEDEKVVKFMGTLKRKLEIAIGPDRYETLVALAKTALCSSRS